ncbi:YugN family protein [Pontibacillus marinus]|uniref:CBS domain-containing protein n=1 Tax=Pontibacillus marinus BH030004 = DSM 16465 TaxID=1385511 RepID=A0A0A5HKC3_9BACI|nr:YugN family protein [Pontibacillus marinus]KGX84067.1 hypothetical protein N783_19280 [Pontibacillus marinus BH030004 = DSM 16465]
MKIEGKGIEGAVVDLHKLDYLMDKAGFVRGGQWDYERVTYDYKLDAAEKNITYYLRVQGYAVEGDVDKGNAAVKLMTPLLGKHYYPHGVEYGDGEDFPTSLVDRSNSLLNKAKELIQEFKKVDTTSIPVSDVMKEDVAVCTPEDNLSTAASKMKENDIGVVPVCESEQKYVGLLTERTMINKGYAENKEGSTKVQEVMDDHAPSATPDTTVEEARNLMNDKNLQHLPIVKGEKLVGIISLSELPTDQHQH